MLVFKRLIAIAVTVGAFAGALFHALISLSIVCHINPPRLFVD